MKRALLFLSVACLLFACTKTNESQDPNMSNITEQGKALAYNAIMQAYPEANAALVERGIISAASIWQLSDGTEDEFASFCAENYKADSASRDALFLALERNFEAMYGRFDAMSVDLKFPLHVIGQPESDVDDIFAAYDPFAHFTDDMFENKVAFITLLNFPIYTLEEKNELGKNWTRRQWAEARLADWFGSRVPAAVTQNISNALTEAENYISNYNIMMGQLRNEAGEQIFADGQALISHWGLRDELKANYANADGRGLEKQRMIHKVMQRIIDQTIPQCVISNDEYTWCPYTNEVRDAKGQLVDAQAEPDTRYVTLRNNFLAEKARDKYCPSAPTAIDRAFNVAMEKSDVEIEAMFTEFISSPEVAEVAELIKERLGRDLEPFDIWYDGFKARSAVSEDLLSAQTRALYPTTKAFEADMTNIMLKLGFAPEVAAFVPTKVVVDPSRGAGHAWGAMSRQNVSRLRSRIPADGFDYKGYNIACHEFGHNVEQTLSMYNVDSYFMAGTPSTAFTEALAFVFQKRDLALLGYNETSDKNEALTYLDIFWGCYEIMGVSLVDLYVWRWLYAHPNCTAAELKTAVMNCAREVWNKYYEPVLGEHDCTLLGIYSHMIDYPLYLPNYPFGHIVESQLEQYFSNHVLGREVARMYPAGRLTPDAWMQNAVGQDVSTAPLLKKAHEAAQIMHQ